MEHRNNRYNFKLSVIENNLGVKYYSYNDLKQ